MTAIKARPPPLPRVLNGIAAAAGLAQPTTWPLLIAAVVACRPPSVGLGFKPPPSIDGMVEAGGDICDRAFLQGPCLLVALSRLLGDAGRRSHYVRSRQ